MFTNEASYFQAQTTFTFHSTTGRTIEAHEGDVLRADHTGVRLATPEELTGWYSFAPKLAHAAAVERLSKFAVQSDGSYKARKLSASEAAAIPEPF